MFRLNSKQMFFLLLVTIFFQPSAQAANDTATWKVQIVADEMCCKGCAQKVAAQLYAAPGVTSVEADVPNRLVTITAKPSPKLTLERLWRAVEQGEGKPSKLITPQATYTLTGLESLPPEERPAAGRYAVVVSKMDCKGCAQKIAAQFYAIRGVKAVSVDLGTRTLFVEPAGDAVLSPWALAGAVTQADDDLLSVSGPYGVFKIERATDQLQRAAAHPSHDQNQGAVR